MKINKLSIISLLAAVFSVLTIRTSHAQVTVSLNMLPPYSPFYRDYAGFNHDYLSTNNTIVTLISSTNAQVYLTASIKKDDNSISIQVKDAYRPSMPINLTANIPQVLTGIQLKNIYGSGSTNDLVLTGVTSNEVIYNQALPEGNYTVCIQARDFSSGAVLGEDCRNIYIAYYEPPQITNPQNMTSVYSTYPQFVLTSWACSTPFRAGISYRLRIVKLPPGVSATDALKNSTQVILDKSNLFTSTYMLDLSSGVILDTGAAYAMQVTASSSLAYFKNNGESEPVVFYYKGTNFKIPGINGVTLNFINPNAKKNYVQVNNETPFLINWNWFDSKKGTLKDTLILNDQAYKTYGIIKYAVKVENSGKNLPSGYKIQPHFTYRKTINRVHDTLVSYLSLPQKVCDSLGFADDYWYKASVEAYDVQSNLVATAESVDFQYRKIKDEEPSIKISANAVIRYMFKDSIGAQYNATNTPVEIDVLKRSSVATSASPPITIDNKTYMKVAQTTGTTDDIGSFHDVVSVPYKFLTGDSLYVRIKLADRYYVDNDFKLLAVRGVERDTSINFGPLVAQTYAYSLKVYVRKAYTSYTISEQNGQMNMKLADSLFNSSEYPYHYSGYGTGSMTYAVESKTLAEGVTIVMYRKNKQTYVPPVEGNIYDYKHTSGYVEVARGITQTEKRDSGDVSFVKFNHLLASVFNGDEYFILALNGKNDPNKTSSNQSGSQFEPNVSLQNVNLPNNSSSVSTASVQNANLPNNTSGNATLQSNLNSFVHSDWNNAINAYTNQAYSEDGFIAEEMPFKLSIKTAIFNKDSLYRQLKTNYDIVSTKPPTSLVKGRIMYHWKSDKANQLRPLANSTFKIVVDYLVNGSPIGSIHSMSGGGGGYTFSTKFFVPEGNDDYSEGMELLDFDKTMAVGKTDAQGNFETEVVNINQKGSLGKGYLVEKNWHYDNNQTTQQPGPGQFDPGDYFHGAGDGWGGDWGGDWGGEWSYTGSLGQYVGGQENLGIQNSVNSGNSVTFNTSGGFYDVASGHSFGGNNGMFTPGMNIQGPINDYIILKNPVTNDDQLVTFQRVYRVVPDNKYIYPTKDTFAVDAFKALNIAKPLTSYVKEVKVRVHSKDMANSNLSQMLVTVFRNLNDKTSDLPLGEGDGQYKYTQLISPQYKTSGEGFDKTAATNLNTGSNVFTTPFELLWSPTRDSLNGWVGFTTLLAGYEDYYVEACSDPTGNKTYQATFSAVNTQINENNPDYWLGNASPDPDTISLKLQPLHSRALIRLIDNATQQSISGGKVGRVTVYKDGNPDRPYKTVDKDGYAEFMANEWPMNKYTSPVKFEGSANGYKKVKDTAAFTYAAMGYQFFYNYLLQPAMTMKGHIVNMDDINKTGVPSYIKVDSGKVVETGWDGKFDNLPVPGVTGTKIFVIPKDVAFFDSTYKVSYAQSLQSNVDMGDFGVYRRRHRIKFIVNTVGNYYLNDATVQLGDSIKKTKSQGTLTYNFENVSVNNFTFVIRGPEGQNYIPQTLNLKNFESKTYVTQIVTLLPGSEVHGNVTLDGKPVRHAKVYIDVVQQSTLWPPFNNSSLNSEANLVVAYTLADGSYHLRGVPANNQIINIHATLDTSFTVNGDIKQANIQNHTAVTNLAMTSFKGMLVNNIYGFPLTVEKIVPVNADSSIIKVTGVVHWSKAISNFYLDETNQILRIRDVTFKSSIVNNKKVGIPQDASVAIEGTTNLKFRYLDKYNVKLTTIPTTGAYGTLFPTPLYITSENDLGVIRGQVSIVDNSFNYPSTYLNFSGAVNNFYLADKVNETSVNTSIGAVTSAMTATQTNNNYYISYADYMLSIQNFINGHQNQPKPLYYLSDQKGDSIKFSLIEFAAKANPVKSFIDVDGKIHLNVNLKCHIDNAKPKDFKLTIDDMVLDNNKVYPASSDSPIDLALEDWTLKVKDWSFSTAEGGIVSTNCLIHTKAIDIPFNKFVLRHDLFLMDEYQLSNLQMAGGSITLNNVKTTNAAIVFDNKTGTDMKPHWRFSISGNPAAELPQLDGLDGIIKLNYIQILSNNEMVFQLQQQSTPFKILNNPLALYSPESVYNGPDFISLSGGLNVGAPRMSPIPLHVDYKNPQSRSFESVQTDFEGQGFVHFTSVDPGNNVPNITINSTEVTIAGNVNEQPNKTFNPMDATFYATSGGTPVYKVDVHHGFVLQLDKKDNNPGITGHKLIVDKGGMSVSGNDWSILTYEGKMSSNTPDQNTQPLDVKYSVMGDISANANGLSVSNINTPFGNMKMVVDFVHECTIGSITVKDIPLGATMLTGTVETLFGKSGFYVAGGCTANVNLPSIVDGTYNMGFMIGAYPITDELWNVVNSYKNPAVKNDCYRNDVKNSLLGFYFTIDRVILDESISFDFILASGYVQANALIGADIYANFAKDAFDVGLEAHAYAHVAAGLGSITGTSISGSLDALGLMKFAYSGGHFNANGSIDLGFKASISQSLVLTTISKDISISCHAAGGTSGFSFSLGSGDPVQKCFK